jgi:hypothetical protein
MTGSSLVTAIDERLRRGKYRVARNVEISVRVKANPHGSKTGSGWQTVRVTADIVASRIYAAPKAVSIISQTLLVSEVENADVDDLANLLAAGEYYAKRKQLPFSSLWLGGYMTIPVVVTKNPDKALIAFAMAKPRQKWRRSHLSAVVDSDTGATYYYHGTGVFGAALFPDMRSALSRFIETKAA